MNISITPQSDLGPLHNPSFPPCPPLPRYTFFYCKSTLHILEFYINGILSHCFYIFVKNQSSGRSVSGHTSVSLIPLSVLRS